MIEAVAIAGQSVLGIIRLVRRRHEAVLQRQMFQAKGLEQGIIGTMNGRHKPTLPACARSRNDANGAATVAMLGLTRFAPKERENGDLFWQDTHENAEFDGRRRAAGIGFDILGGVARRNSAGFATPRFR
jgi:hypothetical protein